MEERLIAADGASGSQHRRGQERPHQLTGIGDIAEDQLGVRIHLIAQDVVHSINRIATGDVGLELRARGPGDVTTRQRNQKVQIWIHTVERRTLGSLIEPRNAAGIRAAMPVSVGPGATTFTLIPKVIASFATAWASA
jgi:hypothetical protein